MKPEVDMSVISRGTLFSVAIRMQSSPGTMSRQKITQGMSKEKNFW